MSESFPYSGVLIVAVIRYAVVTHAWTLRPCRSSPMVRIADATIVWSSAARNMPSISPDSTSRIWRWLSCTPPAGPGSDRAAGRGVVLIVSPDISRRRMRQESTGDRARDRARPRHHAEFDRTFRPNVTPQAVGVPPRQCYRAGTHGRADHPFGTDAGKGPL